MLEKLIRQSRESDADTFLALVRRCINTMKYQLPNAKIRDGYIEVDRNNVIIVGDLHGDLDALETLLYRSKFFDKYALTMIFLGDYGDRGKESVEVYHLILNLKIRFPDRIILLRGNHECLELPFAPHDLPTMLYDRFGSKAELIYDRLKELFNMLYHTLILNDEYLVLHGGVPINITSRDDFIGSETLEQILWNDPREEIKGYMPSWRGYGYYFGRDITIKALESTNTTRVIRAHEPCNGYKINHNGLIVTIFSCKVPYGNEQGAYLLIDKSTTPERLLDGIEVF